MGKRFLVPLVLAGALAGEEAQAQWSVRGVIGPLGGDGFEASTTRGSGSTTTTTTTAIEGDLGALLSVHREVGRRTGVVVEAFGGRLDALQTFENRTPTGPPGRSRLEKELGLVVFQVGGAFFFARRERHSLYALAAAGLSHFDRLISEPADPQPAWSVGLGGDRRLGQSRWRGTIEARYVATRYSTDSLSLDGDLLFVGAGLTYAAR